MQKLEIYYPVLDDKNKVANIAIPRQFINDTKIVLNGRSKVAFLVVENLSHQVQWLEISGKTVEIGQGLSAINVTNVENVEFSRIFDGYIYAIGEWIDG
jgi:hypothetical protein